MVFDSARRAVTAAVTAQRALAAATWPADATVRIRMGLHTTEPHLTDDGYVGVGVHRAARICEAAHGGQVLASAATAGIIEDAELPGIDLLDLGEHPLKGIPGRHRLVQLTVHGLPARFDRPRSSPAPGIGTFLAADLSGWRHVVRRLGDEASAALAGCDVEVAITVHSGRWSGDPGRPVAGTALVRLARLARVTEPGQVLVSQTTAALLDGDRSAPALRDLGEHKVPELDEPTRLYELAH